MARASGVLPVLASLSPTHQPPDRWPWTHHRRRQSRVLHAHARQPYVAIFSVNDTVSLIVTHRLGKVEAVRRLKEGFARSNGQLGVMVVVEKETWRGDTLFFRIRALGQTAAVSIEVLEDALHIEVSLSWRLAKAAKRLLPLLRKEATRLLEKK